MKRFLLLSFILSIFMLGYSQKGTKIPRVTTIVEKQMIYQNAIDEGTGFENPNNPAVTNPNSAKAEVQIGTSWYDLQTNASLGNRLYLHPDNTISAVWTLSNDAVFADRGTGYNYFDGGAWGAFPTARIESVKTGWPTIAPYGENGEIVVSHTGLAPGLLFAKRDTKGTGAWSESYLVGPDATNVLVWPRMITTGENHDVIHVITCGGNAVAYQGQTPALLYSRSSDGGTSWSPQNLVIESIGPDYYTNVNADEYTWANPVGNTIAFGIVDQFKDWIVMKSTDAGDTWQKIIIWEHPYPFFTFPTSLTTDTVWAPDGSGDVALDAEGNVHAVCGLCFWYHDVEGDTYNFFPGLSDGIAYWNENMAPFTAPDQHDALDPYDVLDSTNYIGWSQDINNNGVLEIGDPYTTDIYAYRSIGLCTMPNIAVSPDNRIFLVFAATTEGFTFGNPPQYNYKHIWTRTSYDGGETWEGFIDLTGGLLWTYSESVYPAIAKNTNEYAHYIWQTDDTPGEALTPDHPAHENQMYYYADHITGINNNEANNSTLNVAQNFPNPATLETFVEIKVIENSDLTLEISNLIGQVVNQINVGSVNAGTHVIRLDVSKLDSGVYFYTVKANGSSITNKMIVE